MIERFDWLLYLEVAEHLVARDGEGYWRSAVSRAYYAVFCATRDALEERRGVRFPQTGDAHGEVVRALRGDRATSVSDMGRGLDRLRRLRNRADYRTTE